MSFSIGKRLNHGKYIIEQELGRGGFAITYKASNTVLNQVVVIKALKERLRQAPNFLKQQQQFQAEARRLAKCSHLNIVRVSDFFVDDGLPFIVMDYVPGPTLDQLVLPNRPLCEEVALHYIRQVGDAVQTIHQNGLLHRDIKPQNLILREGTQQVVLIDFGIAREFTPGLTQTHTHFVSEGYAPIEQYLPQAKRSAATDIYGLAATLYSMLTGQVPIAAHLRERFPLTELRQLQPDISESVNKAVMQGLAMEPLNRPATVDEWLALLPGSEHGSSATQIVAPINQVTMLAVAPASRFSHPGEIPGRIVAIEPHTQMSKAQGRWWLPGVAVLATLLLLMIGYYFWRSQTSSSTRQSTPNNLSTPSMFPETAPLPLEDSIKSTEVSPFSPTSETNGSEETDVGETSAPSVIPTSEPLIGEDTSADAQEREQEREAQRHIEEQAKEKEKRREEQAREKEKRREKQARERKKRRDDDDDDD
ncbi:MAG: protein kinase [Xenococcus sp. MO_188.B8]|nr:protein kinase [Xenococcus sp. MO_188.B8]